MNIKDHEEQKYGNKWKWGWHNLQHLSYIVENIYKEGNVALSTYMRYVPNV